MRIYIYLFVCLVDDGTAYCKRAIYNSTLTLVCGVGERERESVLGWVNLWKHGASLQLMGQHEYVTYYVLV